MTEYRDPEYARACLVSGGVFLNLEHVASVNETEHARFLALLGGAEDFSNRLASAWTRADVAYRS